jgi:ATP-dependent phosphofructokinase / diphosphate-dependent phosphofructokinase
MDRALCTAFGAKAVELIAEKQFGRMVSFSGSQITSVPIADATGQLRTVPLNGGFVTAARSMGICLGD